jgi:hypothetical protein
MRNRQQILTCSAFSAVVAAFGAVLLLPAIASWSNRTLLWWLFYVLATAMPVGMGKRPLSGKWRILVSALPGLMPLLYISLQVLVLGQTASLSGLQADNRNFWILVAVLSTMTWLFVWFFSYARAGFILIVSWLIADASEAKVNTISRVLTAIVGLLGVLGLLLTKILSS